MFSQDLFGVFITVCESIFVCDVQPIQGSPLPNLLHFGRLQLEQIQLEVGPLTLRETDKIRKEQ